jgi:heme/copper-type cytochrome/quinol oxidase subunit 2
MPISLPAGQVQLDFAHPSGQAVVALWAVPQRLIDSIMAAVALILAIVALIVIRGIWRGGRTERGASGRSASTIRKLIAVTVLVVCAILLLCGSLASMIAVAVIVAIAIAVQTIIGRIRAA